MKEFGQRYTFYALSRMFFKKITDKNFQTLIPFLRREIDDGRINKKKDLYKAVRSHEKYLISQHGDNSVRYGEELDTRIQQLRHNEGYERPLGYGN